MEIWYQMLDQSYVLLMTNGHQAIETNNQSFGSVEIKGSFSFFVIDRLYLCVCMLHTQMLMCENITMFVKINIFTWLNEYIYQF